MKSFAAQPLMKKIPVLLLGVLFVYYAFFLTRFMKLHYGGNPTGFMCIGKAYKCPGIMSDKMFIRNDGGYDSQLFYYVAVDPLLKHKDLYACNEIDGYRYQRLFYPVLTYALSLGIRDAMPYAMILINLLSTLLGSYFMMRLCDHFKVSRWIGLFYATTVTAYLTLQRTSAEPLYLFLLVVAFYFYIIREDRLKSALVLCLAVMTKEQALGTAAGLFLYEILYKRQVRAAAYFLLPFCAYALVLGLVYVRFGNLEFLTTMPAVDSVSHSRVYPLQGLIDELRHAWGNAPVIQPIILINILAVCAMILLNLVQVARFKHPFFLIGLIYLAMTHLAYSVPVSIDIWGYGRHTADLFIAAAFLYFYQKQKVFLIPLAVSTAAGLTLLYTGFYQ
jgi:hypothetical protein